jgi:hypothetical protein
MNRKGLIFAISLIVLTIGAMVSAFLIVRAVDKSIPVEDGLAGRALRLLATAETLELRSVAPRIDARLASWGALSDLANNGGLEPGKESACGERVEVHPTASEPYALALASNGFSARDFRYYVRWNNPSAKKDCFLSANIQRAFERRFLDRFVKMPGAAGTYSIGVTRDRLVGFAWAGAHLGYAGAYAKYQLMHRQSFAIPFPEASLGAYPVLRAMAQDILQCGSDDPAKAKVCILEKMEKALEARVAVLLVEPADASLRDRVFLFNAMPVTEKATPDELKAAKTDVNAFLKLPAGLDIPFASGHPSAPLIKFALELPAAPPPLPNCGKQGGACLNTGQACHNLEGKSIGPAADCMSGQYCCLPPAEQAIV